MTTSPVTLLVDADLTELRRSERALEGSGFIVTAAESLPQAKTMLAAMSPEVVIADIKLHAFNGLHLAALCAVKHPGTPFIATHDRYDMVLDAEARRLNALYVVKTSSRTELIRTAMTLLDSRRHGFLGIRRSHRKPVAVPTVAEVAAASAEIVDVSYGGVQLKLPTVRSGSVVKDEPPETFDIIFPELDLSLRAERIWTSPDSAAGGWVCGADVSGNDSHRLERWRDFVDSVV
jgi:DNA-binding response OmpR family regulator